jgi:hypothetical protein
VLCRDDDAPFPPETAFFTDKLTHIMHQIWMINFVQSQRLKIWSSVLKFREVWLWRNLRGTCVDVWQNLRRTSASWLRSLSLLDPSTPRQRAGKLMIDMTFLVP